MNQPQPTTSNTIDDLLTVLRCPVDRALLVSEAERLVCTACGRVYPIVGGIPNMLISADAAPPSEH